MKMFAIDTKACRRAAQTDALDGAGVPNTDEAVAAWLGRNWPGQLEDEWGRHDPAYLLVRWRARRPRRNGRKSARDTVRGRQRARQINREKLLSGDGERARAWQSG